MTLTFEDAISDEESQKRWNSLSTNFLKGNYTPAVFVAERQRRGTIHYHGFVVAPVDILEGSDCELIVETKGRRGASRALRDLWAELRAVLPRYHFGRHQLLPVWGPFASRYLTKYLGKEVVGRVRYIGFREPHLVDKKPVSTRQASYKCAWDAAGRPWRAEAARTFRAMPEEAYKRREGRFWASKIQASAVARKKMDYAVLVAFLRQEKDRGILRRDVSQGGEAIVTQNGTPNPSIGDKGASKTSPDKLPLGEGSKLFVDNSLDV